MENIQEVLNGDFKFKQWSGHKAKPVEFENDLSRFGTFVVYETFAAFLLDNDHFREDEDGNLLELSDIMASQKIFDTFLEDHMDVSDIDGIDLNDVIEPIIYAVADDTNTEVKQHFTTVASIHDEVDLLNFINNTLSDLGMVTHSTGGRNEYQVVGIGGRL